MADYFIRVEFSTPEATRFQDRPCFRIVATIVDAINIPFEVFLHKKTLVDPVSGRQADDFVAVCGPFDLSTYPAYEPDVTIDPPFYRLPSVDFLVPGVGVGDTAIQAIEDQLCLLCELLKKLDRLSVVSNHWCPATPTDEELSTTTTTTTPEP